MTTLYLTSMEQQLFAKLSAELREGWVIEGETVHYEDTPEKQMMRIGLVRLHDPVLLALKEKVLQAGTQEHMAALIHSIDLQKVNERDLASLFFAMGPEVLSYLIRSLLREAATDQDIEGITALTVIRHSILNAFAFVP